jgi:hypothetical protein
MKAKWNALLAWIKALFAKAPVTPAAPSAVPEVAPPQVVVDPVITKPVEPKPVNRFTPYLAKYGNDLWAVMNGERINIDRAGYEEALAAGFTKNQAFEDAYLAGRNDQAVGPAFNARKTVLDASDVGGLFEPQAGTTSYTVTGPLKVFLVIDGTEVLTEKASLSVDGGPAKDATVNGTIGEVPAGRHTVLVRHNVVAGRVRLEVQAA